MDAILHLDLPAFIQTIGYIGVFAIIFAESGLFVGFFLPGDSLLFTAGFLASQGYFSIAFLVLLACVGAILGDSVGYAFGRKVGPKIFSREDSFWFHKKHLARAESFYERHGKKTIIIARFIPIVRTFAPIVAGVGKMEYKTFIKFNIIGGILWGAGVTLIGYFLGQIIPDADKYLFYIIVAIVVLSVMPTVIPRILMFCRTREHD